MSLMNEILRSEVELFTKLSGEDGQHTSIGRIGAYLDGYEKGKSEIQWIPCSERLPEKNGEYLVTREAKGIYKYVDIVKKTNASGDIASDIVAWMPLPEPYREEGENR